MDFTQTSGVSSTGGMGEGGVPADTLKRKPTPSDKKTDSLFAKLKTSSRMKDISNVVMVTKLPTLSQEEKDMAKRVNMKEVKDPSTKEQGQVKVDDFVSEEDEWADWDTDYAEGGRVEKSRGIKFETAEELLPEYVDAMVSEITSKSPDKDKKFAQIGFLVENSIRQRLDMKKLVLEVEKKVAQDPANTSDKEVQDTLKLLKTLVLGKSSGKGKPKAQDIFPKA
jgi:hypothetical protein